MNDTQQTDAKPRNPHRPRLCVTVGFAAQAKIAASQIEAVTPRIADALEVLRHSVEELDRLPWFRDVPPQFNIISGLGHTTDRASADSAIAQGYNLHVRYPWNWTATPSSSAMRQRVPTSKGYGGRQIARSNCQAKSTMRPALPRLPLRQWSPTARSSLRSGMVPLPEGADVSTTSWSARSKPVFLSFTYRSIASSPSGCFGQDTRHIPHRTGKPLSSLPDRFRQGLSGL